MTCRRCQSQRLIVLEKKLPGDNEVYRCRDCGYLFSPGAPPRPAAVTTAMETAPAASALRTPAAMAAMEVSPASSLRPPASPAPSAAPPAGGN